MLNKLTKQYIKRLIVLFKKISNMSWVESISNSHGSVGLTFENFLGKKADSSYLPDFDGIELKCTTRYSKYPLYLFTIAFDGPEENEIERIASEYGRYDKDFTDKKVLFTKLSFKKKIVVSDNYKFQLQLNEDKSKIFLCVYDLCDNLIEKRSFLCIKSIYNHYVSKLNTMALIFASTKKINNKKYFRYYKMRIYTCKSFDDFLCLLLNDYINIDLISRIGKSGSDRGRYRNKSFVFSIYKLKIGKLFTCIYEYDVDKKNENIFVPLSDI